MARCGVGDFEGLALICVLLVMVAALTALAGFLCGARDFLQWAHFSLVCFSSAIFNSCLANIRASSQFWVVETAVLFGGGVTVSSLVISSQEHFLAGLGHCCPVFPSAGPHLMGGIRVGAGECCHTISVSPSSTEYFSRDLLCYCRSISSTGVRGGFSKHLSSTFFGCHSLGSSSSPSSTKA